MIRRIAAQYAALRWQLVIAIGVCALLGAMFMSSARPVVMLVDGERVDSDVAPVTTTNHRAYVPLRSVADALGAETDIDEHTGRISVILGSQDLELRIGDSHGTVNGMAFTLKHAPFRVRGRVMVPLDTVAVALHVRAHYDARDARIDVDTPGIGEAP